jgi:hypothetical protein
MDTRCFAALPETAETSSLLAQPKRNQESIKTKKQDVYAAIVISLPGQPVSTCDNSAFDLDRKMHDRLTEMSRSWQ